MRNIGLQLYTARETIKTDGLIPVLKQVADMGYHGIEGGGFMGAMPAKELRNVLDDLGLKYVSGHIGMEQVLGGFESVLEDSVVLGAKYLGLAYLAEPYRTDAAGWMRSGAAMEKAAVQANKHGLTFFYHNHDFEFKKFDGVYGFDILFDNTDAALLKSELDVYWVKKGGADPAAYLRKLNGRAPLVHLKDMTGDGKEFFEIIGDGILDFDAVFKAGDETHVDWYLVEQDVCPQGELFSARKSFANIKARGWLGE